MLNHWIKDIKHEFPDNGFCLEWLKNQLYPNGIECPRCKKVTKHHKVSKRPCYACDNCGNHIYPTAGTIFYKSPTPLKTWFAVIYELSNTQNDISAKKVQKKYGLSYNTAKRMLHKIRALIDEDSYQHFISIVKENDRSGTLRSDQDSENQDKKLKQSIVLKELEKKRPGDFKKRDRIARLLRVQILLAQSPHGLTINEIAKKCSVSRRTVYRDLLALESEIGIPIWQQGSKRGVIEGCFLPLFTLTPEEEITIFMALRLMRNFIYAYNPFLISTFNKLKIAAHEDLKIAIQDTIEKLEKAPRSDGRKLSNLNKLAKAWLSRHRVKIHYQTPFDENPRVYIIEPYCFAPSLFERSSQIIAYCHSTKLVSNFTVTCITGDVSIEPDTYEIPSNFKEADYFDYFSSGWEQTSTSAELVKLRFTKKICSVMTDNIWHPSQRVEPLGDGSGIITFKVHDTLHLRAWIMMWDTEVEVLAPQKLRDEIRNTAKSLVELYQCSQPLPATGVT